jgi:hypothetical protein
MNKQEIIALAESMNFKLDYDKWINTDDSEYSNGEWLRFTSTDDELDERDLRWIWYKIDDDVDNIEYGQYIQSRLVKKRQVLNSLKY